MTLQALLQSVAAATVWLAGLALAPCHVRAAAPVDELAADLHEAVLHMPARAVDRFGREVSGTIAVTSFKPDGAGPFPLVVMNHGRGPTERRIHQPRSRFEPLARYLVGKGFAVLVPSRLGYGEAAAFGDPEDSGSCAAPRRDVAAVAAMSQVLETVELARSLPWIDVRRWVVIGQSVGGMTAVAVAGHNPPGLAAAINFAGGSGGRPDHHPGEPCAPEAMGALWTQQAHGAQVPMLWVYWTNDRFWGAELPRRWADGWRAGGGKVEFHQLPPVVSDGHLGYGTDMDGWVPLVEAYLAQRGFARGGVPNRPAASGFAALGDVDKLPGGPQARALYRQRFLAAKAPRAFALGPEGSSGWAVGDWAIGRALGYCQRRKGVSCRLYAVDDDVVWAP